jgi:predicted RNA-binding Zn-ribbon protein involved in translation (DUF1610 family)
MFRAVLVFSCAECGKDFPTDTRIPDADDMPIFPVTINFKDGMIQFICPECNNINRILMIGNEDIKKRNKLPPMRIMR